jgi:hypothetical protein
MTEEMLLIVAVCLAVIFAIVGFLMFWFHKERKRSSKRLRELRDELSQLKD